MNADGRLYSRGATRFNVADESRKNAGAAFKRERSFQSLLDPQPSEQRTKVGNRYPCAKPFPSSRATATLIVLWCFSRLVAVKPNNFKRLLLTFGALSDLSTEIVTERPFSDTAEVMLTAACDALGASEGVLFTYTDRPSVLASVAAHRYAVLPERCIIPLLPKHVHALTVASGPVILSSSLADVYLGANGNLARDAFRLIAPLRIAGRLVGLLALGDPQEEAVYDRADVEAVALLSSYMALALHSHQLKESLEQRVAENLRLLGSIHKFYDDALEVFATAIDAKHLTLHGHSLRVGRYAAGIGEALGLSSDEVAGLRAAGYLHDIGRVAVDTHLVDKPGALDPQEFREIADHTVVGHRIVSGLEFPWPRIPEVVRSHHERADGSGYPDHLHAGDLGLSARIIAIADSFDAMTSERPWRAPMTAGVALSDLVRHTPGKYDPEAVHALLIQVRRDAVGSNRTPFLDDHVISNIGASDIDHISATLHHKVTFNRTYHA